MNNLISTYVYTFMVGKHEHQNGAARAYATSRFDNDYEINKQIVPSVL